MYEGNELVYFLMASDTYLSIVVYTLFFQNAFYSKSKKCQIGKTTNRNNLRLVNTNKVG